MAKRYYNEGYYAGAESRRSEERQEGGMLSEDKSAIANMPQQVMIKMYPKPEGYMPEDLDDTLRGVDGQMDADTSKRRAHFKPKKV
jgi:hypothetical protein